MAQIDTTARDRFVIEYARGQTVTDAADAASIGRRTAYRLLDDDDVRADIERTRDDIRRRTVDILADASADAARVLLDIATDPERSDTARVSAARAILAESRTYVEVEELRRRVEAIEATGRTGSMADMIRDALRDDAA